MVNLKNIRVYCPEKYKGKDYKKVKENIYETTAVPKQSDDALSFEGVSDEGLLKILRSMDTWKKCENEFGEGLLYLIYDNKKYYKGIDDDEIYMDESDDGNHTFYVTSIMFEQEPEFGENEPTSQFISQYPLEDILEKFDCYCYDEYTDENRKDLVNSYIEFAGDKIEDVEKLLSIINKHVYNKEVDGHVELVIE